MSVDVALDELRDRTDACGPVAFVISVGEGEEPHLVSASVGWDGDALAATVGRSTAANAARTGTASLLWPVADDGYCLIVDGAASLEADGDGEHGGTVRVSPTRAVLHRLASVPAGDERPSCVRILPA